MMQIVTNSLNFKTRNILTFFFLFSLLINSQENYNKNDFIPPLDIPLVLSGTFGEIRTNHFHAGIDVPTNRKTGYPIYACADGYVSRIKVSPWGFGKAIYLNHANGLTTVYAHLEKFNIEIQKYIKKEQFNRKKFRIDQSLNENKFRVKQGEIIGYSGSSGNSTGPHLHFEIRKTKQQKPINPLYFNFPVKDSTKPSIKSIYFYKKLQDGTEERSEFKIKNNSIINETISGEFGIGIEAYDKNDNSSIKTGVNEVKIFLDKQLHYHFKISEFLFSEKKYVNSHIDYKERIISKKKIQKCFLDKNNKLKNAYLVAKNNGLFNNLKNGKHEIKIIVSDSYNNSSEILFYFNYENRNVEKKSVDNQKQNNYYINSDENFVFTDSNFDIMIPKGNLYKDCFFNFEIIKNDNKNSSFKIGDVYTPIHKEIFISIKPDHDFKTKKNKLAIGQLKNKKWSYINSSWENEKLKGAIKSFGVFTIIKDEIKPTIKAVNLNEDMRNKKSIKFIVKDNFSGVDYFSGTLNGDWVLMEYDAKNNLIEHFFEGPITNRKQKLTLTVRDGLGNEKKQDYYFKR